MKKLLVAVLVLCLALSMVPAFALELISGADTYPVETDKTITWYAQGNLNPHEKFADWKESPFHTGLSRETGVNIEWMFPTTGTDGGVYTNTLLADPSSLPDIMRVSWMNNAAQYLEDGIMWDLTPYLEEYAPAYYAFLQTNPAYDRAMKTDDGKYYGFGFFREDGGWNDTYLGPVVRTDWLEECGLEEPVTVEDWEKMLIAFKDKYQARLGFTMNYFSGLTKGIASGVGAYGAFVAAYYLDDNGKVQFAQAQPEWLESMKILHRWYEMGLIDPDVLTMDNDVMRSKVLNNEIGASFTAMSQITNWTADAEAESTEA